MNIKTIIFSPFNKLWGISPSYWLVNTQQDCLRSPSWAAYISDDRQHMWSQSNCKFANSLPLSGLPMYVNTQYKSLLWCFANRWIWLAQQSFSVCWHTCIKWVMSWKVQLHLMFWSIWPRNHCFPTTIILISTKTICLLVCVICKSSNSLALSFEPVRGLEQHLKVCCNTVFSVKRSPLHHGVCTNNILLWTVSPKNK